MKIFYSELAENPAYYSFGYSVYGTLEEGDSIPAQYEKGFLPCVIAKRQPERTMYQTRGVRVLATEFTRRHYHHRVARKAEALGAIEILVHPIAEFTVDDAFLSFMLSYFSFRFGKGSMSEERLRAILDSGWITHVSECKIAGKTAAYMLEHHSDSLAHVWYQAYKKEYEHAHLGSYLYVRLMERAKENAEKHVYFGVTYGPWMRYKSNFAPLEYWTGSEWVYDGNGKKLNALLDTGLQMIPYVDRWRAEHAPFYDVPAVGPFKNETKLLQAMLDGAPRATLLILSIPLLIVLVSFLRSFF